MYTLFKCLYFQCKFMILVKTHNLYMAKMHTYLLDQLSALLCLRLVKMLKTQSAML